MADSDDDESEPELDASTTPVALPAGLRSDWPVPRRAVLGNRGGPIAWVEYLLVRAVLGSLSRLPLALRRPLVSLFAHAAKSIDRRRSDSARVFLKQALGASMPAAELERRVLQAWRYLFDITLDSEAVPRRIPPEKILEHFDIVLSDDAKKVIDSKRGSILATPHVGDWETGSGVLPWLGFDPLYGFAKPPRNRPLSAHIQRRRGMMRMPPRSSRPAACSPCCSTSARANAP